MRRIYFTMFDRRKSTMRVLMLLLLTSISVLSNAYEFSDYPAKGLLHGEKEKRSLSYDCSYHADTERVVCGINIISVATMSQDEYETELAVARREFDSTVTSETITQQLSKKSCSEIQSYLELLKSNDSADKNREKAISQGFVVPDRMTEIELNDTEHSLSLFIEACNSPNESKKGVLLKLALLDVEKNFSTCKVRSQTFTQTFKAMNVLGVKPAWIVDSVAEGDCGVIDTSRFEWTQRGNSNSWEWTYYANRKVANPNGTFTPLMGEPLRCADTYDQSEYPYSIYGKSEHGIDCRYVNFMPLYRQE